MSSHQVSGEIRYGVTIVMLPTPSTLRNFARMIMSFRTNSPLPFQVDNLAAG